MSKRKRDASDVGKKKVNGWREIPKKGDGVQSKGSKLHFGQQEGGVYVWGIGKLAHLWADSSLWGVR